MFSLYGIARTYPLILTAILLLQAGRGTVPQRVLLRGETASGAPQVSVVIWTDRSQYSLRDGIKIGGALQNDGNAPAYVDRRIRWTAAAGGLELEIRNAQGKILPARLLSDALMPPPNEDDTSILVRLEPGSSYGSYVLPLKVKDFFPKPGRYSLRAIYKSWLIKETVAPQLRNLPAVWADSPEIISEAVWIRVSSTAHRVRR
jgi:hypothetical protein